MFKRTFVQFIAVILAGIALYGWLAFFYAPASVSTALAAQQATILHEPDSGLPPVISYQGRLLDPATGQPKPDGGYVMLFALYKEASGGAPFWSESKSVTTNKGLFSTLLGDTTALTLADFNATDTLYLGVSVGGDPEATPRQRLASVSHAIFSFKSATAALADNANAAANADKLDGLDSTSFAAAVHTHKGIDIVDETITSLDVQDLSRSLSFPAQALNLDPVATTYSAVGDGLRWKPTFSGGPNLWITKPADWSGTGNVILKLYFSPFTNGNGEASFFIRPRGLDVGDTVFVGQTSLSADARVTIPANTLGQFRTQQFTISANRFGNKPMWLIGIQRVGTDSGTPETYAGDLVLHTVELIYTAIQ